MKKHHPVLHFLFAILAFGLLTGCEKTADVTTQDSGESAKTVLVNTLAGGESGFADGKGGDAKFRMPEGIASDAAGNLYVADRGNHRIRKITPAGEVSTLAGGEEGFADGIGNAARFHLPEGVASDAAGNLYVADTVNNRIRKITPAGEVSTFAGGEEGFADGVGSDARFFAPSGIAVDAAGNLYVVDRGNNRIRKITPAGEVSTLAGGKRGFADGIGGDAKVCDPPRAGNRGFAGGVESLADVEEGFADGIGGDAMFCGPSGITIDAAGNLYVADIWNYRIRKITPAGEVSTLAGSEEGFADGIGGDARFNLPTGIAIDAAGYLYVADSWNDRIRKITPAGEVSTLAGGEIAGGERGFADGIGGDARFYAPVGIASDAAGNLYVTDIGNHRIRKIEIRRP
ncbi:MAG: hypothetical protein LBE22_04705 [Azoarcus sp.]|nr:hypothetical protein [Azoarcus sp.]